MTCLTILLLVGAVKLPVDPHWYVNVSQLI